MDGGALVQSKAVCQGKSVNPYLLVVDEVETDPRHDAESLADVDVVAKAEAEVGAVFGISAACGSAQNARIHCSLRVAR